MFFSAPPDVIIDAASYRDAEASLLFYGRQSQAGLLSFSEEFFENQGFLIRPVSADASERSRTLSLERDGTLFRLTLDDSDATIRSRVTLKRLTAR